MLPPRAYVFFTLNVIRALSLIGLLLVFASSIVQMVNDIHVIHRLNNPADLISPENGGDNSTLLAAELIHNMTDCDYIEGSTVPNQPAGPFWAIVNRLLIIFQVIVLIFSEIGWPDRFFVAYFPVLGRDFGMGALGIFECLLGAAVLSHHVETFAEVSAFFLFAVGCLNILIGLIFREKGKSKRSITLWRNPVEELPTNRFDFGNLSRQVTGSDRGAAPPSFASTMSNEKPTVLEAIASRPGYGFGRQGEKAAAMKGFIISKPLETLPRYAPKASGSRPSSPTYGLSSRM